MLKSDFLSLLKYFTFLIDNTFDLLDQSNDNNLEFCGEFPIRMKLVVLSE